MRKKKPYSKSAPVVVSEDAKQLLWNFAYLAYLAYKNKSKKEQENSNNEANG